MLLAFDSATEQLAIGLRTPAGDWLRNLPGGASASATLLPTVQVLLAQAGIGFADLQAVAFGHGPGAFTGLRTACSVAQGIALAIDKPVLPIDSLLIVADDARRQAGASIGRVDDAANVADAAMDVSVLMDARMDEVYAARYRWQEGAWTVLRAPALYTLAAVGALWMAAPAANVEGRQRGDEGGDLAVQAGQDGQAGQDAHSTHAGHPSDSQAGNPGGNHAGNGHVGATLLGLVAGSALLAFGPRLALPAGLQHIPQEHDRAAALLRLAASAAAAGPGIDAALALPLYLRDKVALTTLERAAVKAAKFATVMDAGAAADPLSARPAVEAVPAAPGKAPSDGPSDGLSHAPADAPAIRR